MKLTRVKRLAGLLSLMTAPALAQSVPMAASPSGCNSAESRQFDFWLGYWEIHPRDADKIIAHSLIEKRYAGCAIRENWMPLGKELTGGGGSLSMYDPDRRQWRQTWIDSTGVRVDLDGGLEGPVMTLTGKWKNFAGAGKDATVRMHYQLQADRELRQWAESSVDGGKSWTTSFDFLYRRVAGPTTSVSPVP
jgi:hypothetical protein